jgi:hypothetical protein
MNNTGEGCIYIEEEERSRRGTGDIGRGCEYTIQYHISSRECDQKPRNPKNPDGQAKSNGINWVLVQRHFQPEINLHD